MLESSADDLTLMPVHTDGATAIHTQTEDGWTLCGERLARTDARAVVVAGHAMMVDRRTLDRPAGGGLASTLFAAGLDVSWFDSRGHGQSGPLAGQGGRWTYDSIVRYDVPAMVDYGREIARGRPVVIIGHSLVGHAAMIASGLREDFAPDAIVAYAPNLWTPSLEPRRMARLLKAGAIGAWHGVTTLWGYFDSPGLGLGTAAEPRPYVRQFRQMWREDHLAGGGDDYESALARSRVTTLAFSSRKDRLLAAPGSVARFVALARRARVEHVILEGRAAPDHMGFLMPATGRPIWRRTARWILDTVG